MKLSVIIPVYNEVESIREIVQRVQDTKLAWEILLVDDGSIDGTRDLLKEIDGKDDVRVIMHEKNQGKGAAVRTGFDNAKGDVLLIQDADLEYDPRDYPTLIKPIDEAQLWDLIRRLIPMKPTNRTAPIPTLTTRDTAPNTIPVPVRDLEQALRVAGGNNDLAEEMFEQLCQELPLQLTSIREQAAAAEGDELVKTVHRLRGSTAVCGVPALNDVVGRLERSARAKQPQEVRSLLKQLDQEAARLLSPTA